MLNCEQASRSARKRESAFINANWMLKIIWNWSSNWHHWHKVQEFCPEDFFNRFHMKFNTIHNNSNATDGPRWCTKKKQHQTAFGERNFRCGCHIHAVLKYKKKTRKSVYFPLDFLPCAALAFFFKNVVNSWKRPGYNVRLFDVTEIYWNDKVCKKLNQMDWTLRTMSVNSITFE